jgi:hypothetical protein
MDKMKKILIGLILIICLINLAMAATITRNVPPLVSPNQTFTINYTVSGASVIWGATIVDNVLGGCTFPSGNTYYNTVMLSEDGNTKIVQITAPLYGSCKFYGDYQFGIDPIILFVNSTAVINSSSSPIIKINEFDSDIPGTDDSLEWVELYNPNSFSVNISGWKIYDTLASPALKYTIPASTWIAAHSYYLASGISSLNNANESVVLKDALDNIIDQTPFLVDTFDDNRSWQRIPDGSDNWQFVNNTKGSANIISGVPTPPTITITSPINGYSYNYTNIILNANADQAITTWKYNLNNAGNVSFTPTISITGVEGNNNLIVYGINENGTGSSSVSFNVNTTIIVPPTPSNESDDLMVNYVRGKIILDGNPAIAGMEYEVEILNGMNAGYIYSGTVDNNVPAIIQGNGYFDSLDNVHFSTGDSFRVRLSGYDCYSDSIFANGGNGMFEPEQNLVIINCTTPNGAPILDNIGNKTVDEGQLLEFIVHAVDPESQALTYNVVGLPNGASFNSSSRTFSWTPDYSQHGIYYLRFNVTDGENSDYEDIVITVNNVNRMPVINMPDNYSLLMNEIGNATINASDPDGDDLTYSITYENTAQVDCNIVGNLVYFFPVSGWIGNALCILEASDGNLTASKNLNIEVLPINQPPILVMNIPNIEWQEGLVLNDYLNLSRYFRDVDSVLSYSVTGNNHINVSFNNNFASFSAETGWYGTETVIFKATDGEYNVSSNNVNLSVIHIGVPPSFLPLNCENNLIEDIEYNCTLEADNPETSALIFSVISQSNINCSIIGNKLYYKSYLNYNGAGSCNVQASNGHGTDNATLSVSVSGVNDAPILAGIGNKIIMENSTLTINLNASDADIIYGDSLTYSKNVSFGALDVNTGVFTWTPDFGEGSKEGRIYYVNFIVTDSEEASDNEIIMINVTKFNRAPIIEDIENITVNEDESNSSQVVASDPDGDNITYSIVQENINQVDCSVNNSGAINVYPASNWNGLAYCKVRVSDGILYSEKTFYINVTPMYDEPSVTFNPTGNSAEVAVNHSYTFSAVINNNIDNYPYNITWYLNNNFSSSSSSSLSYNFMQSVAGNYLLNASVNVGNLTASQYWNILVKSIEESTCSEIGGNICSASQTCSGTLKITTNTDSCCVGTCIAKPFEFTDADTCFVKNNSIEVEVRDPDSGDKFYIGDEINVKVKVYNNLDDDIDADVKAYLYDMTDNEAVDEDDDSVDIDSDDSEELEFTFKVEDDLDESHEYAIYAYVEGDSNSCNDDYVNIDVKRDKNKLIIDSINMDNDLAICNDNVDMSVKIKNIGSKDQDAYIVVENSELSVNEKTESFEIEKYDDKDTITKTLSFKIPENMTEGTYNLKIKVYYSGETTEATQDITIGRCQQQAISSSDVQAINNAQVSKSQAKATLRKFSLNEQLMILIIALIVGIILTIIAIIVVARKY